MPANGKKGHTYRRDVDQGVLPPHGRLHLLERGGLPDRQRRHAVGSQARDLVFDEGQQGRDHHGDRLVALVHPQRKRGELVTDGLALARGHEQQHVLAIQQRLDGFLLVRSEGGMPPVLLQRLPQLLRRQGVAAGALAGGRHGLVCLCGGGGGNGERGLSSEWAAASSGWVGKPLHVARGEAGGGPKVWWRCGGGVHTDSLPPLVQKAPRRSLRQLAKTLQWGALCRSAWCVCAAAGTGRGWGRRRCASPAAEAGGGGGGGGGLGKTHRRRKKGRERSLETQKRLREEVFEFRWEMGQQDCWWWSGRGGEAVARRQSLHLRASAQPPAWQGPLRFSLPAPAPLPLPPAPLSVV